jgi:hypothetical protein
MPHHYELLFTRFRSFFFERRNLPLAGLIFFAYPAPFYRFINPEKA